MVVKDEHGNIIGLAMILINSERKSLIGKRREYLLDVDGKLGFPGGHQEDNETKLAGTWRELEEETGIDNFQIASPIGICENIFSLDKETSQHEINIIYG